MFDMDKIGKKISEARKKQNMTQMELADRLNISFQAVSNWERGISMPDISKLSELSEILQITVDELVGKESPLMESILKEKTNEYLEKHSVTTEELIDIAPILKPSQLDDVVSNAALDDMSGICEIAPFLSTEVIDILAMKTSESGDYSQIRNLAPFISEQTINEVAKKMGSSNESIDGLLPFLEKETIDSMAAEIYESKGINNMGSFFPFISKAKN
ncbi:MAG: helix-turn-helix domain-containing protein [Eubacteriales bacterium]